MTAHTSNAIQSNDQFHLGKTPLNRLSYHTTSYRDSTLTLANPLLSYNQQQLQQDRLYLKDRIKH